MEQVFNISCGIIFFIGFIWFFVHGYKNNKAWEQCFSISLFVAFTNFLKDMFSSEYHQIINLFRIIVGLIITFIFFYQYKTAEKAKEQDFNKIK